MRILLADDQKKVRSALRLLLEHEPGLEVVGEAVDSDALLSEIEADRPDVVLLDWELPGLCSQQLPPLRLQFPHVNIVALSGRPEARKAALSAGADAFVSKGDPPEQLLTTLHSFNQKK
jgi:DNA-binding NarL/FixJ family response regulator